MLCVHRMAHLLRLETQEGEEVWGKGAESIFAPTGCKVQMQASHCMDLAFCSCELKVQMGCAWYEGQRKLWIELLSKAMHGESHGRMGCGKGTPTIKGWAENESRNILSPEITLKP